MSCRISTGPSTSWSPFSATPRRESSPSGIPTRPSTPSGVPTAACSSPSGRSRGRARSALRATTGRPARLSARRTVSSLLPGPTTPGRCRPAGQMVLPSVSFGPRIPGRKRAILPRPSATSWEAWIRCRWTRPASVRREGTPFPTSLCSFAPARSATPSFRLSAGPACPSPSATTPPWRRKSLSGSWSRRCG